MPRPPTTPVALSKGEAGFIRHFLRIMRNKLVTKLATAAPFPGQSAESFNDFRLRLADKLATTESILRKLGDDPADSPYEDA